MTVVPLPGRSFFCMSADPINSIIAQNIAALSMAGLFLWYVNKRDGLMQTTFDRFSERIDRLTDALNSLQQRLDHVENTNKTRRRTAA